jgi:hypothetical protein
MGRFSTFLLGAVVGAAAIYTALNYHVVRAPDGMHLVPKIDSTLAESYVDIRQFGPREWAQHTSVAAALMRAERGDLLETAAHDALRTGLDRLIGPAPRQTP